MDIFAEIEKIIEDLLDLEEQKITPESYMILDLGAESIDLLELAVAINSRFKIDVKDDELFLARFRHIVTEAQQQQVDVITYVAQRYPFLSGDRIAEILLHIEEGPQLKIKDLVSYITFQLKNV